MVGSARLVLVEGAALLRPEPAVFEGILAGWRLQQESRLLAAPTVDSRDKTLRRFQEFTGEYPWRWGPGDIEEWSVALRSAGRSRTTIRAYQNAVAMFCDFACDGRYGWALVCEEHFGEHPSQICHDWNTADHVADYEGDPARRPFTREELQAFFDYADERVAAARAHGRKGGLAAWRDTAMFKVTYAWGLRRREAAMLDTADFSTNPAAPELGRFGMLSVRWGKAMRGSPPRRRNVATVMPWAVEALQEYLADVRPLYGQATTQALWLTERGGRISVRHINERFAAYRDAMGLPAELTPHCLRHSYVSHLVEEGIDPLLSSNRSAIPGRRRPRCTRRCRTTTRTRCCARRWPGRSRRTTSDTHRRISLASAPGHGGEGYVRHHRDGAPARRAGHHPVTRTGLPARGRHPRAAQPEDPGRPVRHFGGHSR
jgi:integrase